jgi:hypothetical protein
MGTGTLSLASARRYCRNEAIKTCRNSLPVDLVTLVAFPEIIVREANVMAYQDLVRHRVDCDEESL